jgi:uncharacterized protein DUF4394/Calx-beta domain-containing protein
VAAAGLAALPATSAAVPAAGVNAAGTSLLLFDTTTPGTMTAVPITGLGAGETIAGIDRRPATGALYGLGVVDGGASDALRLYRIDPTTGAATSISPSAVTAATGGTDYGVDFNPVVDRVRVINDGHENLRLNPNNGSLSGDDTNLTDAGPDADSRPIEGTAYSNNVPPPFGAGSGGSTTEFGIAPFTDELVIIGGFGGAASGGANGGIVDDEKPLAFNAGTNVNFDIADTGSTGMMTSGTNLGTVNLGSGAFTLIGALAQPLDGFTLLPATTVTLDPRAVATSEAAGTAIITLTRSSIASATTVRVTTEQTNLGISETDTAVSGEDYQPLDTRVNFAADQAQATVTIPIVADAGAEGEEAFTAFLADPGANTGLGDNTALGADRATITIAADPAPPAPPPPPPPDTTGPFAVLVPGAGSLKRATLAARGLTVRYVCGEPCAATFTLKLSRRTLGTAKARLTKAGLGSARVRLTRAGKRALLAALKRRRSVRTTLSATFTDATGNPTAKSSRLTIRR